MALFKFALPLYYFGFFPFLVLSFFIINAGFLMLFSKSLNQSAQQFIRTYMMYTVFKLLVYFILIVVYLITTPVTAKTFAITTGLLYLVYTLYDISIMIPLLNQKK